MFKIGYMFLCIPLFNSTGKYAKKTLLISKLI